MAFMDIFKPAPQPQQQQQQQQQPTNLGDSAPPTKDGKLPEQSGNPVNPLDAYSKMFENAANNSNIQAPSFKLDPKIVTEVANNMDFTQGISQDLMGKALQGDAKALLDVIQSVGRSAYSASLEHTTALTEKHLSQRAEYDAHKLNSGVRQQLTSAELSSAPNYSHPVVKAELNRVASQFAMANPDASPQEVAKAAQKYIADLSAALNPESKATNQQQSSGEVDWTKYLTS